MRSKTIELFSDPLDSLSPRLAWMRNHRVKTHEFTNDPNNERTLNHVCFSRWLAFSPRMPHHEDDDRTRWAGGETEDEAIVNFAKLMGWKLWNEEAAATRPLNYKAA